MLILKSFMKWKENHFQEGLYQYIITSMEKKKGIKELEELLCKYDNLKDQLYVIAKKSGFPNVQCFMRTYNKSVAEIKQYEKDLAFIIKLLVIMK